MDSGAVLRPVGPRPPRVYWIRRLVLLAVLVVLIVGLTKACSGGGTKAGGPAPHATSSPTVTSSPSPVQVTDCRNRDLTVTAATDAATYPAGSMPRLSAVVRNVSDRPCRFRTSPGRRVWTIVSGRDRVWTSADCTVSGSLARSRLRAGKTVAYALVWNRHRSAENCPTDTPAAPPGTYQLSVSVNGVDADTVVFHLTS
jgi:hypothetical protein